MIHCFSAVPSRRRTSSQSSGTSPPEIGEWLTAARKAIADAPDAVFGYGDPHGLPVAGPPEHAYTTAIARLCAVLTP